MGDFENIKLQDKLVTNNTNNKRIPLVVIICDKPGVIFAVATVAIATQFRLATTEND